MNNFMAFLQGVDKGLATFEGLSDDDIEIVRQSLLRSLSDRDGFRNEFKLILKLLRTTTKSE